MKRLTLALLSSILAAGVVACDNAAKTSSSAPDTVESSSPAPEAANNAETLDKSTAKTGQDDAISETRRRQLNADIRAREQRDQAGGNDGQRADGDLRSEVRSKLEANLPASALAVDAKDGAVAVTGTVVDKKQLQKIEPLAKQIKGVKSVEVKAALTSAAKPEPPKPESKVPIKDQTSKQ